MLMARRNYCDGVQYTGLETPSSFPTQYIGVPQGGIVQLKLNENR